jgi:hypothetical protein
MYRLFLILKNRPTPPTDEEALIASGKKILDSGKATEYLVQLEKASNTIIDAFNKQIEKPDVRTSQHANHSPC